MSRNVRSVILIGTAILIVLLLAFAAAIPVRAGETEASTTGLEPLTAFWLAFSAVMVGFLIATAIIIAASGGIRVTARPPWWEGPDPLLRSLPTACELCGRRLRAFTVRNRGTTVLGCAGRLQPMFLRGWLPRRALSMLSHYVYNPIA